MSLLRRTTVAKAEDLHGVRFNSLQRLSLQNRGDRQFRSMRTAAPDDRRPYAPAELRERDKNNNSRVGSVRGWPPDDKNGAAGRMNADGRGDDGETADGKRKGARTGPSAAAATSFPKPAPRTRVPSATVAPPSLAHSDNYENLQQLMNGDSDTGKKVRVTAPTFVDLKPITGRDERVGPRFPAVRLSDARQL